MSDPAAGAPLRVLHLIPGVGSGGGAERSLVETAPGLRAAGIDLHVAYFVDRPTSAVARLRDEGTPVHRVAATGWAGRVRGTRTLLRRLAPGLLHTSLFEADLVGRVAAVGLGVPVLGSLVQANHDPLRDRDPTYSRTRLAVVRAVEGATARRLMAHALANSEAARWAAVRGLRIDPARTTVVHRGRSGRTTGDPPDEVRAEVRAELGIPAGAPVVLSVGRHEFQKDHGTLLRALPALLAAHPDVHLLVAGREGAVTERLHALVGELRLGARVHLLGARDDVGRLLVAADAFVLPSILEGLPGALIEAMAAGVPVVATSIPAVWELVGPDEARLVPTEEPAALAAALAEVLADRAGAQRRAVAARRRFDRDLTLERAVAETAGAYRSVAGVRAT